MIGARFDGVLGELALGDFDLAASADAPPAADRIEIDAERARRGEQARPFGEVAPFARGDEDDAMCAQSESFIRLPEWLRSPHAPRPPCGGGPGWGAAPCLSVWHFEANN